MDAKVSAIISNHKWSNVITDLPDSELKSKILEIDINQYLEKTK